MFASRDTYDYLVFRLNFKHSLSNIVIELKTLTSQLIVELLNSVYINMLQIYFLTCFIKSFKLLKIWGIVNILSKFSGNIIVQECINNSIY